MKKPILCGNKTGYTWNFNCTLSDLFVQYTEQTVYVGGSL